MNRDEMSYEQAKKWILENYFDGDEDVRAFVAGDEETVAMARAVEALSFIIDGRDINCVNLLTTLDASRTKQLYSELDKIQYKLE